MLVFSLLYEQRLKTLSVSNETYKKHECGYHHPRLAFGKERGSYNPLAVFLSEQDSVKELLLGYAISNESEGIKKHQKTMAALCEVFDNKLSGVLRH
jgi:hypothetical protein